MNYSDRLTRIFDGYIDFDQPLQPQMSFGDWLSLLRRDPTIPFSGSSNPGLLSNVNDTLIIFNSTQFRTRQSRSLVESSVR
jgi:hypothetical protein